MPKKENPQTEAMLKKKILWLLKTREFTPRKVILSVLKCDAGKLNRALTALQSSGSVEAQRGRRGGFRLFEVIRIQESDCYPILERSLAKWFEVEEGSILVVHTAFGGAKYTGGKWTRPDFYVVHKVKFKYFHDITVEYVAIEVKVWNSTSSVADVYEVLNHRTRATSAVLMYVGSISDASDTDHYGAIERTCAQHGVGLVFVLITLDDIKNGVAMIEDDRFHEQIEWVAIAPSPKDISEFIDTQFDDASKEEYGKLAGSVSQLKTKS